MHREKNVSPVRLRPRGFTIIELLVVITIIAVLATLLMSVIYAGKYKARDVKRISDLRTIGTALELYRLDAGHYPVALNWVSDCGRAGDNWIPDGTDYSWSSKYIAAMPRDPKQDCSKSPAQTYEYWSDGQKYQVTTELESPTPPSTGPDGGLSFDGFSFLPTAGQPIVATLTSSASSPTADAPIPFTITFSRSVVDFTQSALNVVRGFVNNLVAVSDSIYNFFVTPTDNDIVTVSITANSVHDQNGTGNTAAQYSVEYDSLKPHLALSPDPLPNTVTGAFTVSLNSTIALTDLSASSITVTDGVVSNVVEVAPNDGRNYTFLVTPTSPGTVSVDIQTDVVHSSTGHGNVASNTLTTSYAP